MCNAANSPGHLLKLNSRIEVAGLDNGFSNSRSRPASLR
jgi:hypothetical protein